MRRFFTRGSILTLLVCGLCYANVSQASVRDIRFDQDQRYSAKEMLAAEKSVEICGLLMKQNQINWHFGSDEKLDFNIHFHIGKSVQYPTKMKQSKVGTGQLEVNQEQTYCWMWTNRSAKSASLTVNLEKLK